MDSQSAWTVIVSVLGSGTLSGLTALIVTERIKAAFAKDLETHKSKLNEETLDKIERLKSELHISTAQNSFRFSKTFEETAKVIAAIYEKLVALRRLVELHRMTPPSEAARKRQILQLLRADTTAFVEYFSPHEIYLEKGTSEKVREVYIELKTCIEAVDELDKWEQSDEDNKLQTSVAKLLDHAANISDNINDLLPTLQDEFRRVLGLPIDETPAKTPHAASGQNLR